MAQGMAFLPMVGEPTGGWGTSAACTFKAFAKAQAAGSDQEHGTILATELRHLSTVLRRANARAVLSRAGAPQDSSATAFSNAIAILQAGER